MNLSGKSREEIEQALAHKTRAELLEIIFSMSTVEQHFKPAEIAMRSAMTKRTVLADIHAGNFGGEYYKRSANQITVSATGVNVWRENFRVIVATKPSRSK